MSPTNYTRGRAFEYRVRDRLYKDGAVLVVRAAQSKGAVDLVALWESQGPSLVQCKTGTARMTTADKTRLAEIAARTGSVAVLAEPGPKNRGVTFTTLQEVVSSKSTDTSRQEG